MGRGVSFGGGQSSLGYLFGNGEVPKATSSNSKAPNSKEVVKNDGSSKPSASSSAAGVGTRNIAAGIQSNTGNNYLQADGQNCGNFLTDRPSTKVHAAPGGGSSLGYLFGGGNN